MNSTRIARTGLVLLAALLLPVLPAYAQPPIWEANFGPAIGSLTGEDDSSEEVTLSFAFPYDAVGYTTVHVGTNGCIQLGSLGTDDYIDYDLWEYFEEFYDDAAPLICPINTDWDLTSNGTVHFNDFGNRAVFTWNEIGTDANEDALASFQIQIEQSGRIVFGYNGILDGPDEDLIDDMGEGFVVGITSSNGVDPGPTDLTGGPFTAGGTTYERWCYDLADSCAEGGGVNPKLVGGVKAPRAPGRVPSGNTLPGPINTAFDLDQANVIFEPRGSIVDIPALDSAGLAGLALLLAGAAFVALRRRGIAAR
jgi:hypothetical protein